MRRFARAVAERELLLLGLATPFLLFPGIWTPIGLLLIAVAWACRWLAVGHLSARTAMDVPIILMLIMLGVSLIPSVDLDLSLNRASIYILGVALFYGVVNGLHSERHIHLMGVALVLVGLVIALISLVGTDFTIGRIVQLPALYDRLPPPLIRGLPGSGVIEAYDLVNPRVVAGALAIVLPVPLAYLVFGEGWKLRLLSGLTALVATGVLLLTQAPQGFLGLAAALFLVGMWWSRWILLSLTLGLGGGLLVAWRFLDIGQRISGWLTPQAIETLDFGLYSRAVNGAWGIAMVRDMPYTGPGLNTFPVIDSLYSGGGGHAPHAHNVLIQTAVDLGVPGLLGLLALLGAFAYTLARAYRASCNRNQRALLIGICGAVLAWLAYGMLDSITLGHKPAAALWIMLGLSASMRLRAEPSAMEAIPFPARFTRKWAMALIVPLLLLLAVAGLTRSKIVGAFYLNLGVMEAHRALAAADSQALAAQHLRLAEDYMRRSLEWDPARARARRLLEWVLPGDVSKTRWPRDSANVEGWRSIFGAQE